MLAPDSNSANGVPCRSVKTCRLVPGRLRSVGFGPVVEPPFFALMEALSMQARSQSSRSAYWRCSSKVWWRAFQTPASCQSRSRRQQVTPKPQPISWGSISQGIPDFRTNRIPVKAARLDTLGLPPSGLGGSGGKSGSTLSQSSSDTIFFAMPLKVEALTSYFKGFERSSSGKNRSTTGLAGLYR